MTCYISFYYHQLWLLWSPVLYKHAVYTLYNNVAPSVANRGNPATATLGVANTMPYNKIILDIAFVHN